MKTASVLLSASLTCMASLNADVLTFYVTNNQGTVGSPGTFVSIVDPTSNTVTGYVDCTGHDLTHPVNIHFNSNDTKAYVTCDTVHAIYVIDVSTGAVVGKVDDTLGPLNAPGALDVNLNVTPNIAYVANEGNNTLSVINMSVDTVSGLVDDTLGPFNLPIGVGFSDDGTSALVANFNGGNVSVIDTATNTVTGYVNAALHPFVHPLFVAWSASTKAFVSDHGTGTGFVNVVASGAVTGTVATTGFPPFVQPYTPYEGPDGTMYITDTGNNHVYVVNPATDAVTAIFTGTFSSPLDLVITPDNTTAYVINSGNNTVSIVDVASQTQTGVVDASSFPFFTPDQAQLASVLPPVLLIPPPTSRPLRPICIQGKQGTDQFTAQSRLYNTISWCAGPSLSTAGYNIYRNGVFTKSMSADEKLLYKDYNVTGTIVYSVTAVSSSGMESSPVTVSVP